MMGNERACQIVYRGNSESQALVKLSHRCGGVVRLLPSTAATRYSFTMFLQIEAPFVRSRLVHRRACTILFILPDITTVDLKNLAREGPLVNPFYCWSGFLCVVVVLYSGFDPKY